MQIPSGSSLSGADLTAIVNQVLKTLKQQADRGRNLQYKQVINYNPQVLTQTNPSLIGSYPFYTSFTTAPAITFGQILAGYASNPTPNGLLVVQPFVANWQSDSGGISGFQLGVYALTDVPPNVTNHQITYNIRGKASSYKDNRTTPNWNQAYNNDAVGTHLTTTTGSMESS